MSFHIIVTVVSFRRYRFKGFFDAVFICPGKIAESQSTFRVDEKIVYIVGVYHDLEDYAKKVEQ